MTRERTAIGVQSGCLCRPLPLEISVQARLPSSLPPLRLFLNSPGFSVSASPSFVSPVFVSIFVLSALSVLSSPLFFSPRFLLPLLLLFLHLLFILPFFFLCFFFLCFSFLCFFFLYSFSFPFRGLRLGRSIGIWREWFGLRIGI